VIVKAYVTVRAAQLRLNQESYQASPRIERSVNYAMGIADAPLNETIIDAGSAVYPDRTGDALHRHFKDYISPAVSKFLGLEKQNPIRSGGDKEAQYQRIAIMYKKRYNADFLYKGCLEYLRDKPKFLQFMDLEEESQSKAKQRPVGKKKTMAVEKDAAVLQSIALKSAKDAVAVAVDNDKENHDAKNAFYHGISGLVNLASNYMLMQVADEDTKKRLTQAASGMSLLKMEVELLEMKKKKQLLESDHAVASVDLTSADVDSDNADSDLSTNSGVETTD
jgi:hypothetical protein